MKDNLLKDNAKNILDNFKINIISWYDFDKTNSILLIGDIDKTIVEFLCKKFKKVISIVKDATKIDELYKIANVYSNFNVIDELFFNIEKEDEKFDYILLMNYFYNNTDEDIINFINKISNLVQDDGKILAILKNKLGANEIAEKSFNGFSKIRIENIIKNLKLKYNKFYYALPNEEQTNIIFSDEYLPVENDMRRNLRFSETPTHTGIIENDIFVKVLKDYNSDFKILSNVFFIELSKEKSENEVRAVFYSNIRNEEYQIKTKILKNVAIKEPISELGIKHINEIKNNIDILKKCDINSLDSYEDGKIISKLAINCERLDDKFIELYRKNDLKYKNIISKFKNEILLKLEKTNSKNNVFEKLNIKVDKAILEKLTFIKHGLWDLTLQNVFLINNELYVYDQEWYEENIPIEFILYRTILHCFETISETEKDELYKELEIFEYKDIFYELEEKIQVGITNNDVLKLYGNTMSVDSEYILTNEKNLLIAENNRLEKEMKFQNEIINSKQLINSNIQAWHDLAVSQRDNLQREIILKDNKINELQMAIANSKTLKCAKNVKNVVKNSTRRITQICRKPVKFVCKKVLSKKMKRKLKEKAEYSRKLSKLAGIPMIHEYNHTMKLYDKKTNTYKDVLSQFKLENKTIGIHLHLYYEDLADEFYYYLKNIPYVFDLYISIRQGVKPNEIRKIFKKITNLNHLEVVVSENCGRDFGPMFVLFAEKLKNYDYIMHIHSKKSLRMGQEQSNWRRFLLDNLLGNPELIMKEFYLMENLNCGLVYPENSLYAPPWGYTWLDEKELAKNIYNKIGIEFKDEFLEFSAGSMFWAKKDALKQLLDLNLTWEDFGKDKKQVGGTLEYVFERIPGVVTKHNNYNIAIYRLESNQFILNKGIKSFDAYNEFSAESMAGFLMNYEMVTFDIFDTLVTRKIYNPDDIFLLVEKELKLKNLYVDNYVKLRKDSELQVRKKKNFIGDCNIHEIYDEFSNLANITKEQANEIKNIEIDTELKLCVPRRDMLIIYNKVINAGKKVILISDMYLTKDIIEKILNNCGYFNYSDILISSELGYRKDNETMWDYFFSKYEGCKTIHIGDNEESDMHILANRSKDNLYCASAKRLLELSDYEVKIPKFDLANSVLYGCIYNNSMFNSPYALHNNENTALIKTPFDLGYSILGPIILNYILWVMKSTKNTANNEILLFAAREGYYLQKIYDYLKEKLEIKELEEVEEYYFLVSRRAITVVGIENKEDIYKLFRRIYTGTLKEVLYYRLGYILENEENKIIELPRDFNIVKKIIDDNYDEIMRQVNYERRNYLQYINSLSENMYKKNVTFIDLGYTGTAQYYLSKLMNKKIAGKYFVVTDNVLPLTIGCKVESCYNDNLKDPNIMENPVYKYSIALEGFLTAPYGQLKYIDENLKPQYTFSDNKNKMKYLDEVYNGIISLIDDMVSIYGKDLLDININTDILKENYKTCCLELCKANDNLKKIFDIDDFYACNGFINGADVLKRYLKH